MRKPGRKLNVRGILWRQPRREYRADYKQSNKEQTNAGKRITAQNAAKGDGLSGHGTKGYCDTQVELCEIDE